VSARAPRPTPGTARAERSGSARRPPHLSSRRAPARPLSRSLARPRAAASPPRPRPGPAPSRPVRAQPRAASCCGSDPGLGVSAGGVSGAAAACLGSPEPAETPAGACGVPSREDCPPDSVNRPSLVQLPMDRHVGSSHGRKLWCDG
ncbi:expressed sequence AI316807, isoform CRA_a, partial [Mus musculus]